MREFVAGVLEVLFFPVLWFKWSVYKHCLAKVLLAIWQIFLHENNCNYNSYKFRYKFAFIPFLPLLRETKTKNQSHAEFNRFFERNLLTCYSCSYCSSIWLNTRKISYSVLDVFYIVCYNKPEYYAAVLSTTLDCYTKTWLDIK